ncbi:MAG TPA: circadian clock KaiB family protein [Kofleriaceae bacterium]|nr:circadian clock KaiB family protein [Kofleriaceae bacterium]
MTRAGKPAARPRRSAPRKREPPAAALEVSTASFERATASPPAQLVLRLYVAGTSARSTRAIQNARQICEHFLADRYELEVIDIFQQPKLAKDDQILAVPTLIKRLPLPLRRFIGDLSDRDLLLVGLDVKPKRKPR